MDDAAIDVLFDLAQTNGVALDRSCGGPPASISIATLILSLLKHPPRGAIVIKELVSRVTVFLVR